MKNDPHGDLNSRHRRRSKAVWSYKFAGLNIQRIQPFDVMVCASRSFVGAGIRTFSAVDGRPGMWSHAGQVIVHNGELVVSEANYPEHAYTPVSRYLAADYGGHVKTAWLRVQDGVWDGNLGKKDRSRMACATYHEALEGEKYTLGSLAPMAWLSMLRNLTPFIRGRYVNLPSPEVMKKVFICSAIVDFGWAYGQSVTGWDWFPSSLSPMIPTPDDIFVSKALDFIQGWAVERIPLKEER